MKLLKIVNKLSYSRSTTFFDIVVLLRQLATLISAGLSLLQALTILESSHEKISMRILLYNIKKNILLGQSLSICLREYPNYFDHLTCQLVKLGEHTGRLDTMLQIIAETKEKQFMFKKHFQKALIYPLMIVMAAIILTTIMLIFVIPKFAELFNESSKPLPVLTKLIFNIAAIFNENIIYCILFIIIFIFISCLARHTSYAKTIYNQCLDLPFIRTFIWQLTLARFTQNLNIAISANISLLESLYLATNQNFSNNFKAVIAELRHKISIGFSLHQAMHESKYFPLLIIQLVKVGEESGSLDIMLKKISEHYSANIERLVSQLSQLLEPLLMILLGVLIGGLVIGMYLPIFNLGTTL